MLDENSVSSASRGWTLLGLKLVILSLLNKLKKIKFLLLKKYPERHISKFRQYI